MIGWRQTTLGEVMTLQRGHDLTEEQRTPGLIPVIGSAGQNGWHNIARAEGPGVTVGRSGASAGVVTYVREAYWPHNTVLYVRDFKGNEPLFIANLLRTLPLAELNSGAAQPSLNRNFLYPIPVLVPPLDIQRRIAAILGAYDDLIEVNRRRVALLEDMARGLFEEWFVRFHFPGHEDVTIANTPDGPVPEGWTWKVIGDVTSYINRGLPPKYDDASLSLVINQKCIRDQRLSLQFARKQSKAVPTDKIVRSGDILINSTGVGTLGRVAQAEEVPEGLTADSHVTIVRPLHKADRDFLGMQLLRLQPLLEDMGTGATGQTELSRSAVGSLGIIWPKSELREGFGQWVRPARALVSTLITANNRLVAARDLILPRLISGQLSVAAAERKLLEAA
jgi:type I restriction enzyme S subunit